MAGIWAYRETAYPIITLSPGDQDLIEPVSFSFGKPKVFHWTIGPSKSPVKYADVEKAREDAVASKEKLIKTETDYLVSRGYTMVLDHATDRILWRESRTGRALTRKEAIEWATHYERADRTGAAMKIDELKAEHGIGEDAK